MYDKKLLDSILRRDNLERAQKQVIKNKGAAGVDGMTTGELPLYMLENTKDITRQIRQREYRPLPVKRVEIPKDKDGVRLLGIPTVVDRVIQQAIAQVLTPIFNRQFHPNSYGFRPGRNAEMAIRQALEFMNDGYEWVVDIDLERFFDTVNHDRLMNLISRTVKDG
ncbi:reverse transcriptase domain-containing protein, partial [Allobacillus sp. GCM10007491]